MCVHPYFIENKNRGLSLATLTKSETGRNFIRVHSSNPLSKYKDITGHYTPVGCGTCYECRALRQSYKTQRFSMEALQSDFYFCTLTYDNEHINTLTVQMDGNTIFEHSIASVTHLQNFFKRLRKRDVFGRPFKYFAVSEYGGKHHRSHYHILFAVERDATRTYQEKSLAAVSIGKKIQKEWSINVGTRKQPVYDPLFRYAQKFQNGKLYKNFDFHYVKPTENGNVEDVYYYVSKYILKSDKHVAKSISLLRHLLSDPDASYRLDISSPKEGKIAEMTSEENLEAFTQRVLSIFKPFSLCSKHFGLPRRDKEGNELNPIISDYIRRCIKQSVRNSDVNLRSWFSIVLPNLGTTVPMSPYYWKRYAELEDFTTISENLRATTEFMLKLGEDVPVYFTEYDSYRSYVEPTPEDIQADMVRLAKLQNTITNINRCELLE